LQAFCRATGTQVRIKQVQTSKPRYIRLDHLDIAGNFQLQAFEDDLRFNGQECKEVPRNVATTQDCVSGAQDQRHPSFPCDAQIVRLSSALIQYLLKVTRTVGSAQKPLNTINITQHAFLQEQHVNIIGRRKVCDVNPTVMSRLSRCVEQHVQCEDIELTGLRNITAG
jgi:hypothetical protein